MHAVIGAIILIIVIGIFIKSIWQDAEARDIKSKMDDVDNEIDLVGLEGKLNDKRQKLNKAKDKLLNKNGGK